MQHREVGRCLGRQQELEERLRVLIAAEAVDQDRQAGAMRRQVDAPCCETEVCVWQWLHTLPMYTFYKPAPGRLGGRGGPVRERHIYFLAVQMLSLPTLPALSMT